MQSTMNFKRINNTHTSDIVGRLVYPATPLSHWDDLCLENTELIPIYNPLPLTPEWLSEMDTSLDTRTTTQTNQVHTDLEPHSATSPQDPLMMPSPSSVSTEGASRSSHSRVTEGGTEQAQASNDST